MRFLLCYWVSFFGFQTLANGLTQSEEEALLPGPEENPLNAALHVLKRTLSEEQLVRQFCQDYPKKIQLGDLRPKNTTLPVNCTGFDCADETFMTSESFPVHDAIRTLKRVVNEQKLIQQFCYENILTQEEKIGSELPTNCVDLMCAGSLLSGIYVVYPNRQKEKRIHVYCDMETDGGGWIVFQRRDLYPQRQINFTRDWNAYAKGFGKLNEEFWLGNDNLNLLTSQEDVVLRVDLEDFEGNERYAVYDNFKITNNDTFYKLELGNYSGNAGDSLRYHSDKTFVTYDSRDVKGCAKAYKGGWWYDYCHDSNLNGEYLNGKYLGPKERGVDWYHWKGHWYSLKRVELKFKSSHFPLCKQ